MTIQKFLLLATALPCLLFVNSAWKLSAQEIPVVLDDRMELTLFAAEPDIVTPTGATFDAKGRLLVIESHTHQRPEEYEGPESDRIRIVEDRDGDGKADRFRTFFEGTEATMSIRRGPDNWIYVATRAKIFRIRDTDHDDIADEQQTIVYLETKGNYPHNGLCSLVPDVNGYLYFGMGENLGEAYRMIGTDGSTQRGSGEGGIFRCDLDGGKLTRIATGFWNPFGICIDTHGRIFAVGNDADARPPSRLVQIVETGDYGFQYRYGRSGIHPLQAWDGELPGTLPMVSGTGEAPCELVIYNGKLVTGSWGDFRVERYELIPVGASFRARREIVVQGDENFRPVAFAEASDGSLFFTDWVDKSYPVHGKGRIWRLAWKEQPATQHVPPLSDVEKRAQAASRTVDWEAVDSEDRFLRQFAVAGLAHSSELEAITLDELDGANQRLGLLQALRWKTDHALGQPLSPPVAKLRRALADNHPVVRLFAVRWVADAEIKQLRDDVCQQIEQFFNITPGLFQASIAALEYLDSGTTTFDPENTLKYLVRTLDNDQYSPEIQAMALSMIPIQEVGEALSLDVLKKLVKSDNVRLRREAIRSLVLSDVREKRDILVEIVRNPDIDSAAASDALFGIAKRNWPTVTNHPAVDNEKAWMDQVGTGGDKDRGWRVFNGMGKVNCAKCHAVQGRGGTIGPDLTGIASRTSRRDVLNSILRPGREMAPRFVPTVMVTEEGKTLTGLWQGHDTEGKLEWFLDSTGTRFSVDPDKIEERRASQTSIMPDDLHEGLTVGQIRDLLAFLEDE